MLDVRSVTVNGRLEPTSFTVPNGDAILITGQNGAGKSTLLDCIAGILKPSNGDVINESLAPPAYLPQNPPRPFAYTVGEYLMIGQKQQAGRDYTAKLDIESLLDREITRLSTGQWQRVALTKVMQRDQSVIVLDEPDAPLDDHWSEQLAMVIDEEVARGKVIVMTLHRPEIRKSWKFQRINLTHAVIS